MIRILIAFLAVSALANTALAAPANPSSPHRMQCAQATVVSSAHSSIPEQSAVALLLDEVAKRTGQRWKQSSETLQSNAANSSGCLIVAATKDKMPSVSRMPIHTPQAAESFSLRTSTSSSISLGHPIVLIEGNDARGLLFGIGYLLRHMEMTPGRASIPANLNITEQPAQPIRSHQLGYRFKNNTYDAWTLTQFEQQIRDLAVFGANTIQLITPESDDAKTSPLFPAPALDTLLGISRILDRYGLNCDIFYPELEQDYAQPEDTARELSRFEMLFRQIPRVDAVYIPGGDPGRTPPALLFPLMEKEAAILRRYHPNAKLYVSAQGMNAAHYEDFYQMLQQQPTWLNGVFFGPQSRDSFEQQRARIPARYPMIFYPDIGHAMHAQFPVPQWDPVFALTEGREPIDPRPVDESLIFQKFSSFSIGFVAYSEGVNDDVNKMLWTAWAWNPAASAKAVLEDYARYFIGPQFTQSFATAILDLEKNWRGPLQANTQIPQTLAGLRAIEGNPSTPKDNWRLQLALYRANYDAYLQTRLKAEAAQEAAALAALRKAPASGTESAIQQAEAALAPPMYPPGAEAREQVIGLAGDLYRNIGMQLSVKLYGASNWERGANLDRIDIPLNNRIWYAQQFARIRALQSESAKLAALTQIANWDQPVQPTPGTYYDDLGNPAQEPHLVRGNSFALDPEMYQSAIDGVADRIPTDGWRWSQLTYAEALYESPVELRYQVLDPHQHYKLRVTYAGEDYPLPIRLLVNPDPVPAQCRSHASDAAATCSALPCDPARGCVELQPATLRKTNPQTTEYEIPLSATQSGSLTLQWRQPYGQGGSGRGNQVAEVWLIPIE